ncbi:MAG: hypothetical protein GY906_09850 [bacterium]|nr:hypothetical protein [bacterium]
MRIVEGCVEALLEVFGPWIGGAVFLIAGCWVLFTAPGNEHPLFQAAMSLLLLHTSVLLFVGTGLKKATKFLAITWVIFLVAFLVVAAVLYA